MAGEQHAGIAYCHLRKNSIGQNVVALFHLWRSNSAEDLHNQIVFL